MPQMTITEALSELNLITKKIAKKEETVLGNLTRFDVVADPFSNVGGSLEYVASEMQAIHDLRQRFVKIRSAIAKINTATPVTINQQTLTINEWLNWKREQADSAKGFAERIVKAVKGALDTQSSRPNLIKNDDGTARIVNLVVNVDYPKAIQEASSLEELIEKLDGQLSLKNATVLIEI